MQIAITPGNLANEVANARESCDHPAGDQSQESGEVDRFQAGEVQPGKQATKNNASDARSSEY